MEKLILALVTITRKLRPYFQVHIVEVPTEYPMKQVLHKPETSGRLIKWAIEMSEFDIRYKSRIAVKGQVFHHGIHSSKVYGGYPIGTIPPHLENIRRRGH